MVDSVYAKYTSSILFIGQNSEFRFDISTFVLIY